MVKNVDSLVPTLLAEELVMAKRAWDDLIEEMAEQRRQQASFRRTAIQGQKNVEQIIRWHQRAVGGEHKEAIATLERFSSLLDRLGEVEGRTRDMKQESEVLSKLQPPDLEAFHRIRERFDEVDFDCTKIIDELEGLQSRVQLLDSQKTTKPSRGAKATPIEASTAVGSQDLVVANQPAAVAGAGVAGGSAQLAQQAEAQPELLAVALEKHKAVLDCLMKLMDGVTLAEQNHEQIISTLGEARVSALPKSRQMLEHLIREAREIGSELATYVKADLGPQVLRKLEGLSKGLLGLNSSLSDILAASGNVLGSAGQASGAPDSLQGQGAGSAPATLPEGLIVQLRERMRGCKCGPEWDQIKADHDEAMELLLLFHPAYDCNPMAAIAHAYALQFPPDPSHMLANHTGPAGLSELRQSLARLRDLMLRITKQSLLTLEESPDPESLPAHGPLKQVKDALERAARLQLEQEEAQWRRKEAQRRQREAELAEQCRQEEAERAARQAKQKEFLAKQAALAEQARQKEQEELIQKRKEKGLIIGEEDESVVHAHCTMRRTARNSCVKHKQDCQISGADKYVFLTCTDGCKMHYHQACWRDAERTFREEHTQWKLKRGVECPTEGCTGSVSYYALQHGPLKHPLDVNILVHPEEKKKKHASESKPKGQASKAEREDKGKGAGKESKDSAGFGETSDYSRMSRGNIRNQHSTSRGFVEKPANPKEDGQDTNKEQEVERKVGKGGTAPKAAAIDVSAIDLSSLREVEREHDFGNASQAKKEKRFKPQKQKAVIQPNIHFVDGTERGEGVFGRPSPPRASPPNPSTFFRDFEAEKKTVRDEVSVDVGRAMDFPSLDEASIQKDNPELFTYISNVEDIFKNLAINDGRTSNSLMLEQLDLEGMEERGTVPGAYLTEMLGVFGRITRFHLFSLLSTACVQYQDSDQAQAAYAALNHAETIGQREMKLTYLELYPGETLLRGRLGQQIWETYSKFEADFADLSAAKAGKREREIQVENAKLEAEVRRLNAAAKEFVPTTSEAGNPVAGSASALQERTPSFDLSLVDDLPDHLARLRACEVIGCDANSLKQYLDQEGAFGVVPSQLVSQGWVAKTPTALVLYQIDELKVHGLWRVTGRQVANRIQLATVELVELLPHLEEEQWKDLLEYDDQPNEDGYTGYKYPQALGQEATQTLIRRLWRANRGPPPRPRSVSPPRGLPATKGVVSPRGSAAAWDGGVNADEEETLRIYRQAQEDEALARKLQQELNEQEATQRVTSSHGDTQLALRLQEEEKKAATPSYLSAAQQTAYRIPTRLTPPAVSPTPSPAAADDFDFASFFPTANSPPRASPPQQRQPPPPAEAAADSWSLQDSSFGGGSWDASTLPATSTTPVAARPQTPPNRTGDLSEASLRQHNQRREEVPRPAYRPPPSSEPPSEAFASQVDTREDSDSGDDDILAMLGIGAPKPPKSRPESSASRYEVVSNANTVPGSPESGGLQRGEALTRAASGSSLGSNAAAEADVKKNICRMCNMNKANYLCLPCRHWGPCANCVPSAGQKDSLYPICMREDCNKGCTTLVRVYTK